jgi:endonuclease III
MAQAALVVFSAQGVADENILPHLGAVFRHPRYRHMGVQEWEMVDKKELATILRHCSSQGLKACYINGFLSLILSFGCPRTVEACLAVYGMQKKSACLFLSSVFGCPVGIPVDRHLAQGFRNLGWVSPDCSDPTLMSMQVELWLPMEETAEINNVIAGLRQLYQKREYKDSIAAVAKQCGTRHLDLFNKCTQDLNQTSTARKKLLMTL